MSAKHTPGPWVTLPEEVDRDYIRVRGTRLGDRYKIANVLTPTGDGVPAREADETRANARLIAHAPEMLEALQAAVECGMVPISSAKEGGAFTHSRHVQVADMIRAVIAKATGEDGNG